MADYREIFEKVPEGLTLHDAADGTIIAVNETFCEQLGYAREELLELGFEDLHINEPPYTSDQAEEYIRKAAREGPQSFEWLDQTKSGEPLPVEVNLRQTTIDGEKRILAAVRDITERKERERELKQQNERLEEFAAIVSHDLRNPLSVLKGRLELAEEDCDCEHHEPMATAVERMNELIDDLLTMAREGELSTQQDTHYLADLCESCWLNVATGAARLEIKDDVAIRGAPGRLSQLFENLFRNAVVHGGEEVTVTVGKLDSGEGFYVEDDGPGISVEDEEILFEPTYSTSEDGAGIGLSIVKQVVESHGWAVNVTEGSQGGIRFEFFGVTTQ